MNRDFSLSLHASLLREQITSVVRRLRQETFADTLPWAQLTLLGAIVRLGAEATPAALAKAERLQSSNLAALLRELDAYRLITRSTDSQDRRKIRVSLTRKGYEVLEINRKQRDEWLANAIATCLDEDEQARLIEAGALLARIAAFDANLNPARLNQPPLTSNLTSTRRKSR
jgi:DNA-binding MarR family transcriptional regulator